jgi:hypothetical protein
MYVDLCIRILNDLIIDFVDNEISDISSFCDSYDIREIIKQNTYMNYKDHEYDFGMDNAINTIGELIETDILDEISELIEELPKSIKDMLRLDEIEVYTDKHGIENIINSYFEPDFDDYDDDRYERHHDVTSSEFNAIDAIFDREY